MVFGSMRKIKQKKQVIILKAGETRISTSIFDTKDRDKILRRIVTGTTGLVEKSNRYQLLGYFKIIQHLYSCLKLLKNQRDAGQSVSYTDHIKSERVCMLTKMVESRKVKDTKSTYK